MGIIFKKAEQHGIIAHRFYSDGAGGMMVLDEWPDAESFQAFFGESAGEIRPMMAASWSSGRARSQLLAGSSTRPIVLAGVSRPGWVEKREAGGRPGRAGQWRPPVAHVSRKWRPPAAHVSRNGGRRPPS